MSWLDTLLGTNTDPGRQLNQFTPEQLVWFQQHGVNPTTLTPQQLAIAAVQMNNDLTAQADAKTQADRAAQEAAAREAQAKALQEALQKQQDEEAARKAAADEAARKAAEDELRKIPPVQPLPTEPPTTDPTLPDPKPVDPTPVIDPDAEARRIAALRDAVLSSGKVGARQYFSSRGVDPTDYGQSIDDAITAALGNIPTTEANPASKLDVTGIASGIYTDAETARRAQLSSQLSNRFPETYTNTRVDPSLDDAIINAILSEQRGGADAVVNNMLRRKVITPTGANAAFNDLNNQGITARDRLSTIGSDLLSSERSSIGDIIGRANKTASALPLGTAFDPASYTSEVDKQFNDFVSSLGNTLRARTPGNLFTTSGLGAIAGSAQGAGNTKFNPNALAGVLQEQSEQATKTGNKTGSSRITDFVF
jgi:hypothetical protein